MTRDELRTKMLALADRSLSLPWPIGLNGEDRAIVTASRMFTMRAPDAVLDQILSMLAPMETWTPAPATKWRFHPDWDYTPCVQANGLQKDLLDYVRRMRASDGFLWIACSDYSVLPTMRDEARNAVRLTKSLSVALNITDDDVQDYRQWTAGSLFIMDSSCLLCHVQSGDSWADARQALLEQWGNQTWQILNNPCQFAVTIPASEINVASSWSKVQ